MAKKIVVEGVAFVEESASHDLRIVVLDRGFVVVGNVSFVDDYVVIDNCSTVRRWGTTKGIGQLAMEGPTSNTVLDKQPRTTVHKLQVVQMIECEVSAWKR